MAQQVDITSKEAVKELNQLIETFNTLRTTITGVGDGSKASYRKMATGLNALKQSQSEMLDMVIKYDKSLKNMTKSQRSFKTQLKNTKASLAQTKAELKRVNAELDKTNKKTKEAKSGFSGVVKGAKSLLSAFGLIAGLQIFGNIIKNVISLAGTFDSLHFAMDRIATDSMDAAASEAFLKEITVDFGAELVTTTTRWIKFLAAAKQSNVTLRDTENIFRSMTKAAGVLGLKTDELTGVYLALEQMLSKGKVTTEELRRQLGERLPGAMGIMAAALEVTIPQLDKMLKKGEVLSAEALPKFAQAVEFAYGINTVKTVDTLVAAQNRLTTSWQLFVKGITEGDSWIKNVYSSLLGVATKALEDWKKLLQDGDSDRKDRVADDTAYLVAQLDAKYTRELEMQQNHFGKQEYLNKKQAKAKHELDRAATKEEREERQKAYDQAILDQTNFQIAKNKLIEEFAESQLKSSRDNLQGLEKEQADILANLKSITKSDGYTTSADYSLLNIEGVTNVKEYTEYMRLLGREIEQAEAKFQHFRKITEKGGGVPLDPSEGVTQKRLKEVADLTNQLEIAQIKGIISANKKKIELDEVGYEEQRKLLETNFALEAAIIDRQNNIKVEKARNANKLAIDVNNDAAAKNQANAADVAEKNQQLTEQFNQQIILLDIQKNNKIADNREKLNAQLLAIDKAEFDAKIQRLTTEQNIEVAKIRQIAASSGRTKEDKEKLMQAEADLTIKYTNLKINAEIEYLKAQLRNTHLSDINRQKLLDDIAKLEAQIKIAFDSSSLVDKDDWQNQFQEIMFLAGDFATAIVDIFTAISNSKIEALEAEMKATEESYDKAIELADGNAEKQKQIETEKEIALKKLEDKKLKEEQRRARLRKAQALVDVAINTAVAISRVTAESPIFGLSLIPILAALGALQAAAILAQPIPQYKKGLESADKDHIGMINDGGKQEFVERDGQILTTTKKNAIIPIKKNDTIYKDYDQMASKSLLYRGAHGGVRIDKSSFGNVFNGFDDSIQRGFKKAKINTTIINQIKDSRYEEQMSSWN